ncbi:MAG: hypothetical protein JSS12_03500 [Verrucomicrobia bacterium]|nr:hypothetical protein [Verrucomicrobiota bacterium]
MAGKDMHQQNEILEVLKALDRSVALAPTNSEELANDEDVFMQVIELDYQEKPLSEHLGVSKEVFLPVQQLEDDEIALIVERILDAWDAYNYAAELPEGLPIRKVYETLLSVWDEKVPGIPFGTYHFDFYDSDFGKPEQTV